MSEENEPKQKSYDWLPIQAYYLSHPELSAKQVAEYMEVNPITMERKVTSEGWASLRKEIEKEGSRQLVQQLIQNDYTDKRARLGVLNQMIDKFVQDPTSKVTEAGVLAAIKQLGLMLGEVTARTEQTVLVYEVSVDKFPEPKIIEGEADLIEGDIDDPESPPPMLGPGDERPKES